MLIAALRDVCSAKLDAVLYTACSAAVGAAFSAALYTACRRRVVELR